MQNKTETPVHICQVGKKEKSDYGATHLGAMWALNNPSTQGRGSGPSGEDEGVSLSETVTRECSLQHLV